MSEQPQDPPVDGGAPDPDQVALDGSGPQELSDDEE